MSRNIATKNQLIALAASATEDATRKVANVASAAGDNIRDLAAQIAVIGSDLTIQISDTEPESNDVYWFSIAGESVANLLGTKSNNTRNPIFFSTHANFVAGLSSTYVPKGNSNSFTLAVNAWQENALETSEFIYYADINVTGLTANDYAEINFNRASQNIIATANVCASGETMTGKIRLFAANVPSDSISGEYFIIKGLGGN